MATKFYAGQKDYITKLNEMDSDFLDAVATLGSGAAAEVSAAEAKDWATKTDGTVDGVEHSAKHYALLAEATLANKADASDISNIDNTADIDKPVSTAQQVALNTKANLLTAAQAQSLHSGAIVRAFLYDTSKDSDGGVWRKRCQHTSWYNEVIVSDKWLGQASNEAAARAISGAAAGDYYQNTTDKKFYSLNASAGQTEVFRGNTREFPAQVAIIAETSRVVVYDMTCAGCPMWMVFLSGTTNYWGTSGTNTCVVASQGVLFAGISTGARIINFIADTVRFATSGDGIQAMGGIATRNGAIAWGGSGRYVIVNAQVNDAAMTVLPDAPIDLTTGLPIPTIAVATAGGASIIKHDGTVVNSSSATGMSGASIDSRFTLWLHYGGLSPITGAVSLIGISSAFTLRTYSNSTIPAMQITNETTKVVCPTLRTVVRGSASRLSMLLENQATPVKSMVSYITDSFNTGWMVGDIRGAWLADTVAEAIAGSGDLVTNGTFATDTTGWASSSTLTSTAAVVGGEMQVTPTVVNGRQITVITCVVGKTYKLTGSVRVVSGTGNGAIGWTSNSTGSGVTTSISSNSATTVTGSVDFVATATTMYIIAGDIAATTGAVYGFDNISVKLAEPDRSVKNKGLIVNGSLTKAPVATGSQLIGYSGFSATNYLEQPYNADLDFGTGDFCVMGWVNPNNSNSNVILDRSDVGLAGARLSISYSSDKWWVCCASTNTPYDTGVAVAKGASTLFALIRESGMLKLYLNNVLVHSAANTSNISNATAITRIGLSLQNATGYIRENLALLRIGATAPSADQIAHIYNTERKLFEPNAQCTIDGTSTAVTALSYDEATDLLHVGTSWGRSAFKDLLRVESEATSTGAITSLSAVGGSIITGGANSAQAYQPAQLLKEELLRQEEAKKALGSVPVPHWFTGDGTTAAFTLPLGWTPKFIYKQGLLMREGSSNDYTLGFDGFRWTVTFVDTPLNNHNICIMGVRNG